MRIINNDRVYILPLEQDQAWWMQGVMENIIRSFDGRGTLRFGSGDKNKAFEILDMLGKRKIPAPKIASEFEVKVD